jgi:hypothetical protein
MEGEPLQVWKGIRVGEKVNYIGANTDIPEDAVVDEIVMYDDRDVLVLLRHGDDIWSVDGGNVERRV